MQGKPDEAISEYREAVRLDPTYAEARVSLGVELAKKGLVQEAKMQYHAVLDINPNDSQALDNLARLESQ